MSASTTQRGTFRMARGWMDHPALQHRDPMTKPEAWAWMIEATAYTDTPHDVNGKTLVVKRGQLCASVRTLAKTFRRDIGWTQRFLARLESDTLIKTEVIHNKSVLTICNYDKYQAPLRSSDTGSDTAGDTGVIQERFTSDTQKKEVKNQGGSGVDARDGQGAADPLDAPAAEAPAADPISAGFRAPGGRPSAKPEAPIERAPEVDQLCELYATTRNAAFRGRCSPAFPGHPDRMVADSWLTAGHTEGLPPGRVVMLAREVMQAECKRLADEGRDAPASMRYFNRPIARAIEADANPPALLPAAEVHQLRPNGRAMRPATAKPLTAAQRSAARAERAMGEHAKEFAQ